MFCKQIKFNKLNFPWYLREEVGGKTFMGYNSAIVKNEISAELEIVINVEKLQIEFSSLKHLEIPDSEMSKS